VVEAWAVWRAALRERTSSIGGDPGPHPSIHDTPELSCWVERLGLTPETGPPRDEAPWRVLREIVERYLDDVEDNRAGGGRWTPMTAKLTPFWARYLAQAREAQADAARVEALLPLLRGAVVATLRDTPDRATPDDMLEGALVHLQGHHRLHERPQAVYWTLEACLADLQQKAGK